jgi:hypothetical protein
VSRSRNGGILRISSCKGSEEVDGHLGSRLDQPKAAMAVSFVIDMGDTDDAQWEMRTSRIMGSESFMSISCIRELG